MEDAREQFKNVDLSHLSEAVRGTIQRDKV